VLSNAIILLLNGNSKMDIDLIWNKACVDSLKQVGFSANHAVFMPIFNRLPGAAL